MDAGADAASKIGEVVSQLVIPRPVDELETTFNR
jgi:microcompartment protein CcmL/EutN